jgi:hypothetical protein
MTERTIPAALSREFLARRTARLDAIGPWTTTAEVFTLNIDWSAPVGLRRLWLPVGLRFQIVGWDEIDSFDPDDRMFSLWDFYLSRQDEFAAHFQRLSQDREVGRELGTASWARVVVYRDLDLPANLHPYRLCAEFQFGSELAISYYYEHADAFWGFEA